MINVIDQDKCIGCGTCFKSCSLDVFRLDTDQSKVSPCMAACPAGTDIRGYNALVQQGKLEEAAQKLRQANPFPGITGRICFHSCEKECARNAVDGAVNINAVEQFLGDLDLPEEQPAVRHTAKVAVVGSGPAGLSCACFMARMGYPVTVFEAAPRPGGMLRYGIPAYRLPDAVVEAHVARLEALGVSFRCNTRIGKGGDLTLGDLRRRGYKAFLLAPGTSLSRRIAIEGAELPGVLTTVLFCPDDLQILKAGAAGRRKLLDTALCQLRPGYAAALAEYRKLYDSKSRILKDYHEQPSLLDPLPEFNYRMAQVGAILISMRAHYLRALGEAAGDYHREFSGGREGLTLRYQTVSSIDDPFADRRVLFQQILNHQEAHYRAELDSGQCLTGPHKDDFDAALDGLSIKAYGSQGQTRTAAISLKLAERELFRRDTGEEPVLLLDDVLSELDGTRQDFVLNQIRTGQVLITCCEPEKLTGLGQTVQIHGGQVMRDVS